MNSAPITDDQINDLIDEAINHLCDDSPDYGADTLVEIAHIFAAGGMPQHVFQNIRAHIINSAIERLGKSSTMFIHHKLQKAEQKLFQERRKISGSNNPSAGSIIIH